MHCPICDREDSLINFNRATGDFGDCTTCQAIIAETLADFEDEEDEELF